MHTLTMPIAKAQVLAEESDIQDLVDAVASAITQGWEVVDFDWVDDNVIVSPHKGVMVAWMLPDYLADQLRVDQALMNLVENAMRHGEGEVVLSAEARDGAVELHVRDEGPGFPADLLPSAFERFTRGDPARTRGGAGLGLSIVAAIAAAHGGSASALNRPDGGADVWIALPRQ
jgi:signal transduction histidine kinase